MKQLIAAGFAAWAMCAASPALAVTVINLSGTLSSGVDTHGFFGAPGDSLAGKTFTVRIVMHDDGLVAMKETNDSSFLASDRASIHYAINGVGFAITTPKDYSQAITNSNTGYGSYSSYYTSDSASFGGRSASVYGSIYSPTPGAIPWDILGAYEYRTEVGDTTVFNGGVTNGQQSLSFSGSGNPLRVWIGGTSVVPEPTTWAMMIVGFGGVGVVVRRSRRTAPA